MSAAAVLSREARSHVAHARCEDFAALLPDGSVNLLWLDPPYFRVVDEAWDRAWKTEAAYLEWLRAMVREAARVLAPNGSLYLFASPKMGAAVEMMTSEYLRVLNGITWAKPEPSNAAKYGPENFRQFVQMSERVVFAEKRAAAVSAVGDTIALARGAAGLSRSDLEVRLGYVSKADPSRGTSLAYRWEVEGPGACVPTADDFVRALRACGDDRSEEVLASEYRSLVRPFVAPPSFTDVWTYAAAPSTPSRHVCEKPADMLHDVVFASSRPGDVVCEFFGGSFRMAEVALSHGRRYLGCDADPHWAAVGVERARAAERGTLAMVPARPGKAPRSTGQLSLLDALAGAR